MGLRLKMRLEEYSRMQNLLPHLSLFLQLRKTMRMRTTAHCAPVPEVPDYLLEPGMELDTRKTEQAPMENTAVQIYI